MVPTINQLKKKRRKECFFIVTICIIVGMITRLAYIIAFPVPVRDACFYKEIIRNWIVNKKIPECDGIPPLGLYILKIPAEYFGLEILQGGIVVNMILGLCIIAVAIKTIFLATKTKTIALLIGLIISTHYSLVEYSTQMIRENSYLFFTCLSITTYIKYIELKKIGYLVGCSIFAVASYLCRHEGLELIFAYSLLLAFYSKDNKKAKIFNIMFFLFISILSFFILIYTIGVTPSYFKTYTKRFIIYDKIEDFINLE